MILTVVDGVVDCDDGDGVGVDDYNDDNGDSVLSATHPDFTF